MFYYGDPSESSKLRNEPSHATYTTTREVSTSVV